ncbi:MULTISPECIES: type II toxin-antitoxin system prevent-host-death family antitoxin [unclassified Nocardia]|uniref:type II toxin-antitoxin system prevent-host-death family antitoxin n=1 Tax=unclassified Nocardia TaxID=2637762 RepID=UPI00210626C6|nr:type II toxin-antitoxin system prevent-host-death family antitoxin [Nocardia sp. MH4]
MKLAEAKATLSELVARVRSQHERVTITVHGESQKTTKPLLAQSSSGFISGTGVG